jgi:uncharacterized protein (DUF1330 family)
VTGATVVVVVAKMPAAGVEAFRRYKELVLPLLAPHGARLVRRLRSDDGGTEVHVVEFPSPAALAEYRADPRRSAHAALLAESQAETELLVLSDAPLGNA